MVEAGSACPYAGTFMLDTMVCGTTDVTASWKKVIPTTVYIFSDLAGGGCRLELTNTNSACVETQVINLVPDAGKSTWTSTSLGITSCAPAACIFTTGDKACAVGDRASAPESGPAPDIVVAGTKMTWRIPGEAGDLCGGALQVLTFTRK